MITSAQKLLMARAGAGAGGAFDPSQLASTIAWFDASDSSTVTYNGSNQVSSWMDKISSIDVTRSASAAVTYDSSGGFLTFLEPEGGLTNTSTRLGLTANPDIFIASVFEVADNAEKRLVTIGTFAATGILSVSTDISWRFNNGNLVTTEDVAINTPELLVWQRSSGSNYGASTGYLNGTQLTQASSANPSNVPTDTLAEFGIGTGFNGGALGDFDSDVYEIIICESSTDADRQQIEGYLAHKYGLDGSLPSGHPYKTSPT